MTSPDLDEQPLCGSNPAPVAESSSDQAEIACQNLQNSGAETVVWLESLPEVAIWLATEILYCCFFGAACFSPLRKILILGYFQLLPSGMALIASLLAADRPGKSRLGLKILAIIHFGSAPFITWMYYTMATQPHAILQCGMLFWHLSLLYIMYYPTALTISPAVAGRVRPRNLLVSFFTYGILCPFLAIIFCAFFLSHAPNLSFLAELFEQLWRTRFGQAYLAISALFTFTLFLNSLWQLKTALSTISGRQSPAENK